MTHWRRIRSYVFATLGCAAGALAFAGLALLTDALVGQLEGLAFKIVNHIQYFLLAIAFFLSVLSAFAVLIGAIWLFIVVSAPIMDEDLP